MFTRNVSYDSTNSLKSRLSFIGPAVIFLSDLIERGETRFVGLGLPVGEVAGLLAQLDLAHYGGDGSLRSCI